MRKIEKRMSITTRLTFFYSAILIAVMILGSAVTFLGLNFVFINQAELQISEAYQSMTLSVEKGGNIGWQMVKDLGFAQGIVVKIYDKRDNLVLDTGFKTPYYDIEESSNKVLVFQNISNYVLYRNYDMAQGGENYRVQIIKNMREYSKFTKVLFAILLVLLLLGTAVAFILGKVMSKKMFKPVEEVIQTARRISIEDLNERLSVAGPDDEIRELAETFNDMLDRLTGYIENQKRFVSDASHELRTPISVIQGYIDLLDLYGNSDSELLEESIESIRQETQNMTFLIEQLLYLARRDSKIEHFDMEEFNLSDLVEAVVQETTMIDDVHSLVYHLEPDVAIYGSKQGIKQMMRIFIDNSRKFTPEGGQIKVKLSRQGGRALLSISDTGIGISEEDLPHIFERFYCADKSRNKSKAGSGLGLAIAKSIVDEHKGRIIVNSIVDKGTDFKVLI